MKPYGCATRYNRNHFSPRVPLLIPSFADRVLAPAQCTTLVGLSDGSYDVEFLDFQLSHVAKQFLGFCQWLHSDRSLSQLFTAVEEDRECQHVRRMAAERQNMATSFAEDFLIDEDGPRVREPEGFLS